MGIVIYMIIIQLFLGHYEGLVICIINNNILPSASTSSERSISYRFPTTILYKVLISPMRVTWRTSLLTMFHVAHKLWGSSSWNLLQPPATFYHLGPSFLLSTMYSNILNLPSSLSVRDQVFTPVQKKL